MIWRPKCGDLVRVNYRVKSMCYQGFRGIVITAAKGPGPINALVLCTKGLVVVPRGNLWRQETQGG